MLSTTRQPLTVDGLAIGDTVALFIGRAEFTGEYLGKTYLHGRWRCLLRDDEGMTLFIPETLIDRVVMLRSVEQRLAGEDWPILSVRQSDLVALKKTWPAVLGCAAVWLAVAVVAWHRWRT